VADAKATAADPTTDGVIGAGQVVAHRNRTTGPIPNVAPQETDLAETHANRD